MNPVTATAFSDELQKIAASMSQLQAAARRVLKNSAKGTRGKKTVPVTFRETAGAVPETIASPVRTSTIPTKAQFSESQRNPILGTSGIGKDLRRQGEVAKAYNESGLSGKILTPPGSFSREIQPVWGGSGLKNPKVSRGLNITGTLHEGFERKVKPGRVAAFATHNSPEVLLDEHNLTSQMRGHGSAGTRTMMEAIRSNSGEKQKLREMFKQYYGPDVEKKLGIDFFKKGKIPKAMKKHFAKKYREERMASGARFRTSEYSPESLKRAVE